MASAAEKFRANEKTEHELAEERRKAAMERMKKNDKKSEESEKGEVDLTEEMEEAMENK